MRRAIFLLLQNNSEVWKNALQKYHNTFSWALCAARLFAVCMAWWRTSIRTLLSYSSVSQWPLGRPDIWGDSVEIMAPKTVGRAAAMAKRRSERSAPLVRQMSRKRVSA